MDLLALDLTNGISIRKWDRADSVTRPENAIDDTLPDRGVSVGDDPEAADDRRSSMPDGFPIAVSMQETGSGRAVRPMSGLRGKTRALPFGTDTGPTQ